MHRPGDDRKRRATALVTGAARRVGRAIALELAAASVDVFVHFNRSAAQAEQTAERARGFGVDSWTVRADLTSPDQVESMFARVSQQAGRLDFLVNSAAVFIRTPPTELDETAFDVHMDVNLKAPYLCSLHASRLMSGGGCIVNIADAAAERPLVNYVPYCVSKAGLLMLTRSMARALAPGIRVNAVAPGTVLFRPDEDEETRRKVVARIPLGRTGTPGDVARTVRFLCLEGGHITGAVIPVDGGRTLT